MSKMFSKECDEHRRNHVNCIGCSSEFECAGIARKAVESAEKIQELLEPYLEESEL